MKFKVTATSYTDLYKIVEADSADEAHQIAADNDGDWLEDGLGDFKIDDVQEVTDND